MVKISLHLTHDALGGSHSLFGFGTLTLPPDGIPAGNYEGVLNEAQTNAEPDAEKEVDS